MSEKLKMFIELLSKHCKINQSSFTSNEIHTILNAVNEYEKLNGETLESEKSVCPACSSDDTFRVQLIHSKCRKCDTRWTN